MAADLIGFEGLSNSAGQRYANPSYRVALNFYPLDYSPRAFFWGMAGSRPTNRARPVDWAPLKMTGGQPDASVVRFTWDKHLGHPSAQWIASIKEHSGGIDWRAQEIIDGDWVDIAILRNGVHLPLARGVVDSVREATSSAGGATVRVWNVSGRDHGAFFEHPITWTTFYSMDLDQISGGLIGHDVNFEQGGRPDQMFPLLVKAAMGPGKLGGMWELPPSLAEKFSGKKRLYDLLRVIPYSASRLDPSSGLRGVCFRGPQLWMEGGTTLHQTLMNWANPALNEIYYDLIPAGESDPPNGLPNFYFREFGKPRVIEPALVSDFGDIGAFIRERPFPNTVEGDCSMWFDLPTWTIPTWLIESADLGFGGHERFNLFSLNVEQGLVGTDPQLPIAKPMWNRESVQKWGLRAFDQTTPFYAKSQDQFYEERKRWLRLLVDWFAPAPYLRQGTISFGIGLPEVRVGQRVILDSGLGADQCEQFYVEGVRHEWRWPPGTMKTTLTVTHGFRGTDQEYLSQVQELSAQYDDVQEPTLLAEPKRKIEVSISGPITRVR